MFLGKTEVNDPPLTLNGEASKAQGLKYFKESQWLSSAICFTNCIKFGFDVQVSQLNRSEVYLRLGWNNSAFHDAQDAFNSNALSSELVREGRRPHAEGVICNGSIQCGPSNCYKSVTR